MKTVWMVVRYWPGGKREVVRAYFDEGLARYEAGRAVGTDGMIALESIAVVGAETVDSDVDEQK